MIKNLKTLFLKKDYKLLLKLANRTNLTEWEKYYIGLSYLEVGMPDECIEFLTPLLYDSNKFLLTSRYLGMAYYMLGKYDASYQYFKRHIENTQEQQNLNKWIKLLDYRGQYLHYDYRDLSFHFLDELCQTSIHNFYQSYCNAYCRLQNEFNISMGKKIDVYIYSSNKDRLGNTLCYAVPSFNMIHTNYKVNGGHELAHIFLHHLHEYMVKTRFIDEGFATFFDKEQFFDPEVVKSGLKKNIDVIFYWKNYDKFVQSEVNLVAGQFMAFCWSIYGKKRIIQFLKNQTIKNAYKTFGISFRLNIQKFNKMVSVN